MFRMSLEKITLWFCRKAHKQAEVTADTKANTHHCKETTKYFMDFRKEDTHEWMKLFTMLLQYMQTDCYYNLHDIPTDRRICQCLGKRKRNLKATKIWCSSF